MWCVGVLLNINPTVGCSGYRLVILLILEDVLISTCSTSHVSMYILYFQHLSPAL